MVTKALIYVLILLVCSLTASFILLGIEKFFNIDMGTIPFFIAGGLVGVIVPMVINNND